MNCQMLNVASSKLHGSSRTFYPRLNIKDLQVFSFLHLSAQAVFPVAVEPAVAVALFAVAAEPAVAVALFAVAVEPAVAVAQPVAVVSPAANAVEPAP